MAKGEHLCRVGNFTWPTFDMLLRFRLSKALSLIVKFCFSVHFIALFVVEWLTELSLVRSSFHADLQGGDKLESSSYGSSDDSRTENSDVMSVHSDSSVATARERLLSTEYTLVGEEAPSEGTHPRLRRIRSTVSEERTEMPHSPPSGLSRSLGSINTTFSDAGSLRFQRTHNETVPHIPILRNNISIKMTSPKGDKCPCTSGVEASPRSMNSRNNLSVRNAFIRSKSDGSSGSSSPSREEKLSPKRLPYSAR